MKLYKILFEHYAPKDSHGGIHSFIVANSDEEVYEHVNKIAYWDDDDEVHRTSHEEWEFPCDGDCESYARADIIKRRGDIGYENGLEDAYYGVTQWGWDKGTPIGPGEVTTLMRVGVLKK